MVCKYMYSQVEIYLHVYEIILRTVRFFTCNNSLNISGEFCLLMIAFANSLYPDQDEQNVGLFLDPNCLTLQ